VTAYTKKRLSTIIVATLLSVTGAWFLTPLELPQAQAYSLMGCRFGTATIRWDHYSSTASIPYQSQWVNSVSKWNNSTDVNIIQATPADILFYPANWGATGWDGQAPNSVGCDNGLQSRGQGFHVYLNTNYASGYSSAKRESVIGHEIGHYLGLAHVGNSTTACGNVTLMHPTTDRRWDACSVNSPRSDDINGVNSLY
jgi:hypothetical protein